MAIVLEAPEQLEATRPAALHVEPPAAVAAANLLDGDAAANEPQREGSISITIRLVRAVDDPVAAFAGQAGEVFDAYVDAEGCTWIPLATGDIMLEPEEFEIVEPVGSQQDTVLSADEPTAVPTVQEAASMKLYCFASDTTNHLPSVLKRTPALLSKGRSHSKAPSFASQILTLRPPQVPVATSLESGESTMELSPG